MNVTATWEPPVDPNAPKSQLQDSAFAFQGERKEPLIDAAHVRNAIARFNQVEGVDDDERDLAFANIQKAAAFFGVHLSEKSWHELT